MNQIQNPQLPDILYLTKALVLLQLPYPKDNNMAGASQPSPSERFPIPPYPENVGTQQGEPLNFSKLQPLKAQFPDGGTGPAAPGGVNPDGTSVDSALPLAPSPPLLQPFPPARQGTKPPNSPMI